MPELSRFYGIVIRMFANDHNPPHFHAQYGEHSATIDIATRSIIEGSLPRRCRNMVAEWSELHEQELMSAWHTLKSGTPPQKIAPLS
ncbi:DUF4160 domain-containing protein [Candidatus Poriferisocius sp.]|uniref:DUF4160 domain-containing protein n=1 Tax=Candidatus Poriferisocius sp. TaxID=3101276 RepID=UPI003B0272D1